MTRRGRLPAEVANSHLRTWEQHQALELPGRTAALDAMFDVITATVARGPERPLRLLDLAGGPGGVALAAAARFPTATVTIVDIDPVVLHLAESAVEASGTGGRVRAVGADLSAPGWSGRTGGPFDAVMAVLAVHYFAPERLWQLYGELRAAIRPGGLLLVTDRIPEPGLGDVAGALDAHHRERRARSLAAGHPDWRSWWREVRTDPRLAGRFAERDRVAPSLASAEFHPDVAWHVAALNAAGFAAAGTVWRCHASAAICAR